MLIKSNGDYTFDLVYTLHDTNKKILKQINNVPLEIQIKIAEFFRKEHSIYTKAHVLGKLYSFLSELSKTDDIGLILNKLMGDSKQKSVISQLNEFIVNWEAFILDIYIVSRMYRNF